MDFSEAGYYAACWSIAFLAGCSRTLRTGKYRNCWHLISGGASGGFLAFSVVCFSVPHAGDHWSPAGLGISAGIGLAGQSLHDWILDKWLVKILGLDKEK